MAKKHTSIQDRERARKLAKAAKREQEQCKPIEDVACACGCGWWPEKDMLYWVIADKLFRYQKCANKYWRKEK
ncbi:hypothetical protein LCGC14_0346200 [marine sediment metagenome]|uniref:Uncharacterized protein n=1 Tax=marine sediment metagenome TaxID=412755 RepID=A0A0F9WK55_9ZZZZ